MIETVGVIGAGVIGRGVAQNLAQTGHAVILVDLSDEILQAAGKDIKNNIRMQRLWQRTADRSDLNEILARISYTTDYAALKNAEVVIENAVEKWEVKKAIFQRIDKVCEPECIFAANTSAVSITRLAAQTKRASKILGMHFMNPVPMKEVVEVIKGHHTSEDTLTVASELLQRMGKRGIVVNDSPGFVSNRVLMLTINEAIFLVQEQVATVEEIDDIFKGCFGHKMGPLETADLIGLDTILLSIEVLHDSFRDSKYRPCQLLQRMVDAGLCGRKSGQGFYTYEVQ